MNTSTRDFFFSKYCLLIILFRRREDATHVHPSWHARESGETRHHRGLVWSCLWPGIQQCHDSVCPWYLGQTVSGHQAKTRVKLPPHSALERSVVSTGHKPGINHPATHGEEMERERQTDRDRGRVVRAFRQKPDIAKEIK
ncbi:hypothetical protein ElyMa_000293800 [Elysia marginata]|uniref:Uncharacterized protein n=1 Tax=Elysia marginata TaxID=1093978 RepID=A0AAV4F6R8_9GAST|nr:hypothetical protein ElyMa_000293800 [Elysia marginata]